MDNMSTLDFLSWWHDADGDFDGEAKMAAWKKYCYDNSYTNIKDVPQNRQAEFMAVWALIFG